MLKSRRTGRTNEQLAKLLELESDSNNLVEGYDGQCGRIAVYEKSSGGKGHHPWQAAIRVRGQNGTSFHWCGAVLLDSHHFLTAAHCLNGYSKDSYVVRVGDHYADITEQSEQEVHIDRWHIHEHFRKGQANNNDIAMLTTKEAVVFNSFVRPICLPPNGAVYESHRNCTISGWGDKSCKFFPFYFVSLK